jgi:predicted HAD superfamily Cof-like phosphohydrolase
MNSNDDVKKFMLAGEQNVYGEPGVPDHTGLPPERFEQAALYMKLIVEEYKELMHAWNETDIIEIADACADLKWVIEGLEHSLGIPQQAVWDEVARSNMSKMVDGKLIKREDGKVLKPDTFVPPNIKQILES